MLLTQRQNPSFGSRNYNEPVMDVVPKPIMKIPPGNWIAKQLKIINSDSRENFPKTPLSRRDGKKYSSLYKVDIGEAEHLDMSAQDLQELRNLEFVEEMKSKVTLEGVFGPPKKKDQKMFKRWHIPSRLVNDDYDIPEYQPNRRSGSVGNTGPIRKTPAATDIQRQKTLPVLPRQSFESPRINVTPRREPNTARLPTRQTGLSNTPRRSVPNMTRPLGSRKGSSAPVPAINNNQSLHHTFQPTAVPKASEWMKNAPAADRKLIEKLLCNTQEQSESKKVLDKTLLPEARLSIEKWMQKASDKEQEVAIKFFKTIGGSEIMGPKEKKSRLEQVLRVLDRSKTDNDVSMFSINADEKNGKLKYIRLLSPRTRERKWMHTTWHHLPEYKDDDPVNNRSSHYLNPQRMRGLDYTIHPDWGC